MNIGKDIEEDWVQVTKQLRRFPLSGYFVILMREMGLRTLSKQYGGRRIKILKGSEVLFIRHALL